MKKKSFRGVSVAILAAAVALLSFVLPDRASAQRVRVPQERRAPTSMMRVPPSHMRFWIGNRPYIYHNGYFYRGWRGRYFMFRPPLGARLRFLPYGFWSFQIGPALYYYGGGVYYRYIPGENMYVVVPRPQQAPPPPNSDEDIMYLTDGKTLSGVFVGATADSIRFQVKDSVQTVPITHVKSINFAPSTFKEKK